MENNSEKNFKTSPLLMWILVGIHYFILFGLVFDLFKISESPLSSGFGLGIVITTWMLFLSDIIISKVYNKSFWLIVMICTPTIAEPIYLLQRKRLINMKRKKVKWEPAIGQN